jgi:sugar/nucleoside kinase (ribokinase family)
MDSPPVIRFLAAGRLWRDFILPFNSPPSLDIPGGNLLYTAIGLKVWENGIGLVGRVGSDYPQKWLEDMTRYGLDRRGIHVVPEPLDQRNFVAYSDANKRQNDNPVSHFARLGLPYPKDLLEYAPPPFALDSRTRPTPLTFRHSDIPNDYLDATSAHLAPSDYLSHTLLPTILRQGRISTITLDPAPGTMNPAFWDDFPALLKGITALLTSEARLRTLFQSRTTNLWEMIEGVGAWGCPIIVVKRGSAGQYLYETSTHRRWLIPAYPARVADPTGAGDAFCGGFLAGFRRTYDPLEAALHGNIAASFVVESSGAYYALDALPGLAEARLLALKDLVQRL